MSRLLIAMMIPIHLRYSSWWYTEFLKQLQKYFDEIIILGEPMISARDVGFMQDTPETFSSTSNSIALEYVQMQQYLEMKT